jgi:hypothetical protein
MGGRIGGGESGDEPVEGFRDLAEDVHRPHRIVGVFEVVVRVGDLEHLRAGLPRRVTMPQAVRGPADKQARR